MSSRYKIPILLLIALAALWTVSNSLPGSRLLYGLIAAIAATLAYFFLPWKDPTRLLYKKSAPPKTVEEARKRFDTLTNGQCKPQAAALEFDVTGNPRSLDRYFPIVNMLGEAEIELFYKLIHYIASHSNFDIQFISANRADITDQLPESARNLVAGHLAEVFFFRRDILERFFHAPRHFQLYSTPEAFQQDEGVAGGDYNHTRQSIQLVLSRLFEGFNDATPGVCPFLHELGHMLDHFDAGSGSMGRTEGLYPGLSPQDGNIFASKARDSFLKGKRLELTRYLARQNGDLSQPMPIGHPYVFQNDGEFLAGYLEMFFRNPHYFADQNADLFSAYAELFSCDTRKAWKRDFPHYVNANKSFYASGEIPPKSGLTVPDEA